MIGHSGIDERALTLPATSPDHARAARLRRNHDEPLTTGEADALYTANPSRTSAWPTHFCGADLNVYKTKKASKVRRHLYFLSQIT